MISRTAGFFGAMAIFSLSACTSEEEAIKETQDKIKNPEQKKKCNADQKYYSYFEKGCDDDVTLATWKCNLDSLKGFVSTYEASEFYTEVAKLDPDASVLKQSAENLASIEKIIADGYNEFMECGDSEQERTLSAGNVATYKLAVVTLGKAVVEGTQAGYSFQQTALLKEVAIDLQKYLSDLAGGRSLSLTPFTDISNKTRQVTGY